MDGVILFADDEIHDIENKNGEVSRSSENALYNLLCKDHPVLGVDSIELAEKCINSVANFSAIILDWQFKDNNLGVSNDDDDTLQFVKAPSSKTNRTLQFLLENEIYSLIYIYSNENVNELFGKKLKAKYGKRIKIKKKLNIKNAGKAKEVIIADIKKWKEENKNLLVPLKWSNTINHSTQKIFNELADADDNWIKDVYDSATKDGMDEALFVIDIFQQLLSENLIQSKDLIDSIKDLAGFSLPGTDELAVAKLFRRVFYSKLNKNAPIMTGDICKFGRNKFGIVLTPECDTGEICNDDTMTFELCVFQKDSFDKFLALPLNLEYKRGLYNNWSNGSNKEKEKLKKLTELFNQKESRYHILPSFPFNNKLNNSAVIDFGASVEKHRSKAVRKYERNYKLNSPFIQQLRQRYISHLGRIGVPALPLSLKNFNLK